MRRTKNVQVSAGIKVDYHPPKHAPRQIVDFNFAGKVCQGVIDQILTWYIYIGPVAKVYHTYTIVAGRQAFRDIPESAIIRSK